MKFGKRGTAKLVANPILVVVVIGLVAVLAYVILFNPFRTGDAEISVGYILSDGSEVTLPSDSAISFVYDMQTLSWYTNEQKTEKITGIWGMLNVKPVLEEMTDESVTVTWTKSLTRYWTMPDGTVINVSVVTAVPGNAEVPPNVKTGIETSKMIYTLPTSDLSVGTRYQYKFNYLVSAIATDPTAGTKTATTTVNNTVFVYWGGGASLSFGSADVSVGMLQLTG